MALLSSETPASSHLRSGAGPAQPATPVGPPSLSYEIGVPSFMHCAGGLPKSQPLRSWGTVSLSSRAWMDCPSRKRPWCLGAGQQGRCLSSAFTSRNVSLCPAEVGGDLETFSLLLPYPTCAAVTGWKVSSECVGDDTSEAGDPFFQSLENDRNFLVSGEQSRIKVLRKYGHFQGGPIFFNHLSFSPLPKRQHGAVGICIACHCRFESWLCEFSAMFLSLLVRRLSHL